MCVSLFIELITSTLKTGCGELKGSMVWTITRTCSSLSICRLKHIRCCCDILTHMDAVMSAWVSSEIYGLFCVHITF